MFYSLMEFIHRKWNRFCEWNKYRRDVLMFITQSLIAIVGIGSMWIVFHVSSKQNSLTEESLKLTRENNILDSKPYVFPSNPKKIIQRGYDVAVLPFVNSGKTPAYKFRIDYLFQRWKTIQKADTFSYPYDST